MLIVQAGVGPLLTAGTLELVAADIPSYVKCWTSENAVQVGDAQNIGITRAVGHRAHDFERRIHDRLQLVPFGDGFLILAHEGVVAAFDRIVVAVVVILTHR